MGTSHRRLSSIWTIDDSLENSRLVLQSNLDNSKTIEERRKLGQYATPTILAQDIITYAISNVENPNNIKFLDPAFGTGAFYSALLGEVGHNNIVLATAIEIDPLYSQAATNFWSDYSINIINTDFTKFDPINKYNLIICNPPYVRHHLIDYDDKIRINNKTHLITGFKLSGLAGLYCHFLLQSIRWMEEDAVATWLIPSEFMDVNYGKVIKEFLLNRVELVRIHRFNPDDVQFKDALVSSAVICFKNKKSNKKIVNFSFGGTLNSPKEYKEIDKDVLKNETKWSRFPCCQQTSKKTSDHKIKDYFDVKRGIATGGNDFFILEESRIKELGLPFEFFRSILPSARHLKTTEIEADNFGEPLLPKRLYLLDCRLSEDTIYKNYPLLWKYLESGRLSVGNGYICKNRKCWYFQEQRESPLYICTYMGRQRNINNSAFKFIFNKSKAIISNTYLGLYPHKNFADFLNQNPELKRTVWQLLTNITPDNLHNEGRIYGGGLNKIEPKELLNVSIPFFENFIPEKLSRRFSRLF